jgi:hypothetical protein
MKPVYGSRKANNTLLALENNGDAHKKQPGLSFDEKALQLRKVCVCLKVNF